MTATWEARCTEPACLDAAPTPRQGLTAAFDALRHTTVMHGGMTIDGVVLAETWGWNGASWTELCPSGSCTSSLGPRYGSSSVFDVERGAVLLLGGLTSSSNSDCGDGPYLWDGSAWSTFDGGGPEPRYAPGLAYDTERDVVVVFGGACYEIPFGDTLELGASWSDPCTEQACLDSVPAPRSSMAMAYDAARRETVVFGGTLAEGQSDETFTWNGSRWTARNPATKPSARAGARMVFVSDRQRLVLFGGWDLTTTLADTWEWDGTNWHLLASTGPPDRQRPALAYDSTRRRLVMFGGIRGTAGGEATTLNDTWELVVE
jgi:hypothetical protein